MIGLQNLAVIWFMHCAVSKFSKIAVKIRSIKT